MRRAGILVITLVAGCGGGSDTASGGAAGKGGVMGLGGATNPSSATGTDGSPGTGGVFGNGGGMALDAVAGTGGFVGVGGAIPADGPRGTGGIVDASPSTGVDAAAATGGAIGTGGLAVTGGTIGTGTGGVVGRGGTIGAGGSSGVGGSTAVVDGGARDAQPICGQAGTACALPGSPCCTGTTCVTFPDFGGDFCAADCTTGDGCNSGCCTGLVNGGAVCAPSSYCATCKKAGEEGCQSNGDCCNGSACITELSGGVATRNVCKDYCTANSACYSGCCAPVIDATYFVCSASNFCSSPSPAPISSQPLGTFTVTVSREDANLYKVQGKSLWIKTQLCLELVFFDAASLTWGGKYASGNEIAFSSGNKCTVVDVLVGQ